MSRKLFAAGFIVLAVTFTAFALDRGVISYFRQEVVISIAGDVMLDRGVANAIARNGAAYPFEGVSKIFSQDDLTVANLECALTLGSGGAMPEKEFVFKADPGIAQTLKTAGFDALMLANNHTMDYLSGGLTDTIKTLDGAGLLYSGAKQGKGKVQPCFIKKNGISIGILSYSEFPPEDYTYYEGDTAIAYVGDGNLDEMKKDVSKAAEQCDFLIVYFHWGIEYLNDACNAQIEIAHAAIDSGASAVIGTHPHVLQGRETYKGAPIYYSIGNFVFDNQMLDGTDEAVILQLTVGKSGIVAIKELPVVIKNCRPQLADSQKAAEIEEDLRLYSRQFNN